jgi:copper chaperone CopZ
MKVIKPISLALLLLGAVNPLSAQVEKVAMRTTGISCGVCAAVSEVNLRRLPGVDKVTISRSKEAIMLSYKPGAGSFRPQEFRELLKPLEVGVVQFQISARGRVHEESGKRFFIAAKDKFEIVTVPNGTKVPLDTSLIVEGILNDQTSPMQLKILSIKPVK